MTLLLLWTLALLPVADEPSLFQNLSSERFTTLPLKKLLSPTAITIVDGICYIGCDLLEARPGIYRYDLAKNETTLIFHLAQTEVSGLSHAEGRLTLASARLFSSLPSEWHGQIMTFDPKLKYKGETIDLKVDSRCSDGSFGCGLVSAIQLSAEKWLVVTQQSPAEVLIYEHQGKNWVNTINLPVTFQGKIAILSECVLIGDQLVFLVRNHWALASAALNEVFKDSAWRLETTLAFDLKPLKKALPVGNAGLATDGYAEGFVLDDQGKLYVLINNRGYSFDGLAGQVRTKPQLVTYTPAVKADDSGASDQTPQERAKPVAPPR